VKVGQLCRARLFHQGVLEHLAGEVVLEASAVSLLGASEVVLDLIVFVGDLFHNIRL
jgi:hypothetical protein